MTSMTDDRTKQWYIVHTYSGFETLLTCHLGTFVCYGEH